MDQIFDRLERLFKSWVAPEADQAGRPGGPSSGDPDLDSAMEELDDFLDRDREAAERREKERREREARARANAAGPKTAGPHPRIAAAYATLGLPYGAPFAQVKATYKKLLMQHHPDRHTADPAALKRATELSAKINEAYRLLETWTSTGTVPEA